MSTTHAPARIEIEETTDRDVWTGLLAQAGRAPLEQGWAYGEAVARHHGQSVTRMVIRLDGAPRGPLQAFRRSLLPVATLCRIVRSKLGLGGDFFTLAGTYM